MLDKLSFLDEQKVRDLAGEYMTPLYVYSSRVLADRAKEALAFGGPYGFKVRYAIKANPHIGILQLFNDLGLVFDASSGEEVELLLAAGIDGHKIALNSQQLPLNLEELIKAGVFFTATSIHQLEIIGQLLPGSEIGVRLNPGLGSGTSNRVTTGGVAAGFGIWYEYIPQIHEIAAKYNLKIIKIHTHIGAGTEPDLWQESAGITLGLVREFPTATIVSLGGGFKVARMLTEQTANLAIIGQRITSLLETFYQETGRKLSLEIEPGTYLAANAGVLIAKVIDKTDTGKDGYEFLRLNTGMNDILRPTLYGAQHPLIVVGQANTPVSTKNYIVIGHNCESGDILTPAKGDPESIKTRTLATAKIGDYIVIEGAGAYCASMRAIGYNAFMPADEVFTTN